METNNDYNFSLFKPKSDYTRRVRNIIVSMLIFWALAVFGFQILLKVVEKPTPEKALTTFESVWGKFTAGSATIEEKTDLVNSITAVLGKSTVKKDQKEILSQVISWITYNEMDSAGKALLQKNVLSFSLGRDSLTKPMSDENYLIVKEHIGIAKSDAIKQVAEFYHYKEASLEASIVVFYLKGEDVQQPDEEMMNTIPEIMKLYLVHNQSFLTNFKFLGFPFHYFYTAEFLLILFVLLCLIYHFRIERLQKKYKIVE